MIDHGPYLDNSNLAWKIDTESTFVLFVTWLNFSTEQGCDFVSVTDLELNVELGRYSGSLLPTISHGGAYVVLHGWWASKLKNKKEQENQDEGCIELQLVLCWCPLNVGQFDLCNCYCFFLSVGQRVLRNSFVSDHDQRQTDKAKTR